MKGRKTGGRVKGTPNKVTSEGKRMIAEMLMEYQEKGRMSEDFYALDSEKRLTIAERLFNYILPKQQSVKADVENKTVDPSLAEILNKYANE